ncbi:hypothetical protein [Microvirga puerhi]|uniref:Uncharacterized protein n=1 Tax=Microvirga puerhi TaxID=2876078 RepID=A0ABS7VKA4_9HYPH|nr:hypothetical protein [Microvirga puerhi]MBZ6075962.1 hypothetical protein [Microvirga puerhi]
MLVIGLSKLESYWSYHPDAEATLRALQALLSTADCADSDAMLRQWSGIMRRNREGFSIALDPEGCEVLFQANFALGLIQILAVQSISPQGATADERQRTTNQNPGGLRASPA